MVRGKDYYRNGPRKEIDTLINILCQNSSWILDSVILILAWVMAQTFHWFIMKQFIYFSTAKNHRLCRMSFPKEDDIIPKENETRTNNILKYLNNIWIFSLNIPKRMRLRYQKFKILLKNGVMFSTFHYLMNVLWNYQESG